MTEKEKKMNTLVEDSGIITHFKTTKILRKNGWSVLVSPYYHDPISDVVRETDLIAEKQFNSAPYGASVQINVQAFIECKFIKQEVVFWFDKMDRKKAVSSLEKETGLDVVDSVIRNKSSGDTTPDKFHYFEIDSVAKLFSANSNKEDVIYKAMNQCLHSQIYSRQRGKRPIANEFSQHREVFSTVVQYPVIVCDNFSYLSEVQFSETGEFTTEKLKNHFILETNYRDDYFLIDIVDINYLETFLGQFEKEANSLVYAYEGKR
jgi:hypothetical protein